MMIRDTRLGTALSVGMLVMALAVGCGEDEEGENQSQNQNGATNQVDTGFECTSTGTVEDDIEEDTTFSPDNNDCLVFTETVKVVDDALLTIEPGVVLQFEENTGLDVDEGRLTAAGDADEPVIMTGTEQQAGWWKGIQFRDTRSVDNRLDHVVIEYAGSTDTLSRTDGRANLVLNNRSGDGDPEVAIDNTTLQHSGAFGLYVDNGANITSFTDNTLTENAEGAATITPPEVGMFDDSSSFDGNDDDVVVVRGGDDINDGEDHVWADLGVPFRVTETFKLADDAHVDLDAGAELEFEENVGIDIDEGTFSANGESDDVIELKPSQEGASAYWAGIQFRDTRSVDNRLEHVAILGAAGEDLNRTDLVAGLVLNSRTSDDPEVTLHDVEIGDFGDEAAVGVDDDAVVTECSNMIGFGDDDVIGDGADDFISACGL